MNQAFYTVSNQAFNNYYLALLENIRTGQDIKFYFKELEYNQYNWLREPQESLHDLMTQHAKDLRNRYEKLSFYYSGGFDSHTIYQVLEQAKVHLDSIVVASSQHHPWFPTQVYDWLRANHWDPDTEIINIDSADMSQCSLFHNDQWIFQDQGLILRYYNAGFSTLEQLLEEKYQSKTWAYITGYEKPRLVFRQGTWHSRQLASVLEHSFGRDHIEYFFLEPKIAIKQSHLLKQNVKNFIKQKNLPLYDGDWAEGKYGNGKQAQGLLQYNLACGRSNELIPGASCLQKNISEKWCGVSAINTKGSWQDLDNVSPDSVFVRQALANKLHTAQNFLRGVYELYSDQTIKKHLDHNHLFRSSRKNLLYDLPFVWSKEYCIGN